MGGCCPIINRFATYFSESEHMHPNFYLSKELISFDNWHRADYFTKTVFGWLLDLPLGHAFGIFGLEWGTESLIESIPKNYDTYVITPGTEYVDWHWIRQFCYRVPDSQVIVVCPYYTVLDQIPNLKLITFDVWPYNLKFCLDKISYLPVNLLTNIAGPVNLVNRKYKISSLAHRISQFRTYVCAHLYRTWNPEEYIISWRKRLAKQEDLYLLDPTGHHRIDDVIQFIKNEFWELDIGLTDDFVNAPINVLDYNWSAYTECIINCSNESVNNSYQFINDIGHILPGPYLTEKTYKVLLSGTALLPVGQYQTYSHLESQGFVFDYPWDKSYDQISGDIDRVAKILDCIDDIKKISLKDLEELTLHSRRFNREYIFSGDYFQYINRINYQNIEKFAETL